MSGTQTDRVGTFLKWRTTTALLFRVTLVTLCTGWQATQSSVAAVYSYTPVNSATDTWSLGTHWNAIPTSAAATELTFSNNSTVLANGLNNTNTDNKAGAFSLNILDLRGTGPASGAATINISSSSTGNYLDFVANDATAPVVNLDALAGSAGLTYNVNSNVALTNSTSFQGNGTAAFRFGGVISGGGNLVKSGTSDLTLMGNNTYTGTTTVSGGTLVQGVAGAVPTSNLTVNTAGALDMNGFNVAVKGLSGNGFISNESMLDSVTLSVGNGDADGSFGGVIQDGGQAVALVKEGAGRQILAGANSYSSGTLVNAGTLQAATVNALPGWNAGRVAVASGATLAVNVGGAGEWTSTDIDVLAAAGSGWTGWTLGLDTSHGNFSYTGTPGAGIAGQMGVKKIGSGTLTFATANTYTGATTIDSGTLCQGVANVVPGGSDLVVNAGGTFDLGGFSTTIGHLTGSGVITNGSTANNVVLSFDNGTLDGTFAGVIQDGAGSSAGKKVSVVKNGTGRQILSGPNTYTGGTTINAGTLQVGNSSSLPGWNVAHRVIVNSGGTLSISVGGPGEWTASSLDQLVTTADFMSGSSFGIDTTNAGGKFTYTGTGIPGNAGLMKLGAGTLAFTGSNTYTGTTTVNGGVLLAKTTAQLPGWNVAHRVVVNNGGTIGVNAGGAGEWTSSNIDDLITAADLWSGSSMAIDTTNATGGTFTYNGVGIRGRSGLMKIGGGTLIMSVVHPTDPYHGVTTINGGTLQVKTTALLPRWNVAHQVVLNDGGTLAVNVGGSGEWTSSNIDDLITAADLWTGSSVGIDTTNAASGSFTYSGIGIRGQNGLTKLGAGKLIISVAHPTSPYAGATIVSGGTLVQGVAGALPNGNDLVVNVGGTLDLASFDATVDGLSGNGGTITNDSTVGSVTLSVGNGNSDGAFAGVIKNGTGASAGKILSLVKNGSGRQILSGVNTYTGGTTINDGILQASKTSSLPGWNVASQVAVNTGGTIAVNAGGAGEWTSSNIDDLITAADLWNGSCVGIDTSNAGGSFTYNGIGIRGSAGLTKLGAGTLIQSVVHPTDPYRGVTTINGGTLQVRTTSLLPRWNVAHQVVVNTGGTIALNVGGAGEWTSANIDALIGAADLYSGSSVAVATTNAAGGSFTYNGVGIRGSNGLTKLGPGTLILSVTHPTSPYDGVTIVKAGTLRMPTAGSNHVLAAGADIQAGKMVFDYTGVGDDPALSVSGILTASYNGGAWDIGQIRNTTAGTTGLTLGWADNATAKQVTIMATYAGDANLSGTVDVADLTLLLNNYNKAGKGWNDGDFNYDGSVTVADLTALLNKYNKSVVGSVAAVAGSSMGSSPVPEPSSIVMLATLSALTIAWTMMRRCGAFHSSIPR